MGNDKKTVIVNDIVLKRIELYLGVPLVFFGLLACVWWLPQVITKELYENLYLPFINDLPIILHIRSGIFILAILPSVAMTLPILVVGFIRKGLKVDCSHYQKHIDLYFKILVYVAITGFLLSFLMNFYIAERIEGKGYSPCSYLNEFGVTRRVTGYVIHPMLCVPEEKRVKAVEDYKQIRMYYPHLLESKES